MSEDWRSVAGYEGFYEVSSIGRVRSVDRWYVRANGHRQFRRGRVLKPTMAGTGRSYEYVTLRFGKKRSVHGLVCEAFHGPRPDRSMEAAHNNGVSADNRASNLRWATRAENVADGRRHHVYLPYPLPGEENGSSKLTDDGVRAMRELYVSGEFTQRELAVRFGVSKSLVHRVVSRQGWKHIA